MGHMKRLESSFEVFAEYVEIFLEINTNMALHD